MKKIVKTILLGCLVILPLFALSACSSRSHFATQKDQWQTYTKEKKIKIGFEKSEKINICQFFSKFHSSLPDDSHRLFGVKFFALR